MRRKRAIIAVSVIALIVAIILLSVQAYYITITLIVGTLITGYREIWSLIVSKRLLPIDERVRKNTNKSIRNEGIFSP